MRFARQGYRRKHFATLESGVRHHVNLRHTHVMRPTDGLADLHRKRFRNCVYAFALVRMSAHQRGGMPSQQIDESLVLLFTHRVVNQRCCRRSFSRLGCLVSRMLLDRRLGGVNQHIGEGSPTGCAAVGSVLTLATFSHAVLDFNLFTNYHGLPYRIPHQLDPGENPTHPVRQSPS